RAAQPATAQAASEYDGSEGEHETERTPGGEDRNEKHERKITLRSRDAAELCVLDERDQTRESAHPRDSVPTAERQRCEAEQHLEGGDRARNLQIAGFQHDDSLFHGG